MIATPRERIKTLSEILRTLSASLEYQMAESSEFEPVDIYVDLSRGHNKDLIFESAVPGVAVQSLSSMSVPPPGYTILGNGGGGNVDLSGVILYINRKNGPIFQVGEDDLYVYYPVRKLYLSNPEIEEGGILHLRVYRDPLFLFAVSPRSTWRYYNVKGQQENLATEKTLDKIKTTTDLIKTNTDGLAKETTLSNTKNTLHNDLVDIANDLNTLLPPLATEQTLADIYDFLAILTDIYDTLALVENYLKNSLDGYSKQYTVSSSAVTSGEDVKVSDGKAVAIYADADNTAEVVLTFNGQTTPVVGTHAGLKPGQGIAIQIENLNKIKMKAASGSQKINIVVEV